MKLSRKKLLSVLIMMCITTGIAIYAESQWHIISNIFRWQTEVIKAQPLEIYPDPNTPFPETILTGVPYTIVVDVENPNNITINGKIMLNVTRTGITWDDVYVTTDAKYEGHPVWVIKEAQVGDTLVFIIEVNYVSDTYFHFQPGLNDNVTYFTIQFNVEGTYELALAVCQSGGIM